ncbi:hypothetical protein EOE18_12195 [Novosphingobium umbonatum]|uniref:Lipopolysaccharide biosynthesis protein n=1 Tax=Novosphingobium umbonatum TaxID=1908524 RepID=A0A437N2V9_9SPHN|nr:oligosaccharide flippase family protein [Novosphingobium umbonatum]RVU04253.1 hypothetical protein EOE18_12195 [Novosphingobium umbonatum]
MNALVAKIGPLLSALSRAPADLSTAEGRAQERLRRARLTTLAAMASKVISVGTQLISVPLTLPYLGMERYGLWIVLSTVVAMQSCVDLGIGSGILNQAAAAHGREDRRAVRVIASSGLIALMLPALLLWTGFMLSRDHVDWSALFQLTTPEAKRDIMPTLQVFACIFALSIPANLVYRVQIGTQQGFRASLWQCLGNALMLPAILLVLWCDAGLPALVGVFVGMPVLANLANTLLFFGWQSRDIRPSLGWLSWASIGQALRQGAAFMTVQTGNIVISVCVPMVITRVLGTAHVPEYAVPERLLALVVMLTSMYVQPLWPAYREALERGDGAWVARSYRRTLLQVIGAGGLVLALLGLAMPFILHIWVADRVQPSAWLVAGLCLMKLGEALVFVNAVALSALEELRSQSIMAVLGAFAMTWGLAMICGRWGVVSIPWAGALILAMALLMPGGWIIRRRLLGRYQEP